LNSPKSLLLFSLFLVSFFTISKELSSSVLGVKIGDEYESVIFTLTNNCKKLDIKIINPVRFPLAKLSEKHVICKKLIDGGELAITIADGVVVHLYGKNIDEQLIIKPSNETKNYLDYVVYDNYLHWEDRIERSTTLISKEGLHPNLFVWKNPYLELSSEKYHYPLSDVGTPDILKFGSTLKALKPIFEESCNPLEIVETDIWLENHPKKQIQVNCFNYNFLGFPRKIEAVFGDDILELAWILTAKQEEKRVKNALIEIYGKVQGSNENWDVFHEGKVYLRKDKPEVLAISNKLVPLIKKKYGFRK